MHRHTLSLLLWIATVFLIIPVSGEGTTIRRMSFEELCAQAPVIIIGRCTAVSVEQDARTGTVHTRSVFAVEEMLKGPAGQRQITVRMPGGRLGTRTATVHGMPQFREQEPVVLFLTGPGRAGYPWVMGLGQGCYRISTDPETGAALVRSDPVDGALHETTPESLRKSSAAGAPATLDQLKQRILDQIQRTFPVVEKEY